jgi:hypothetical protein
MPTKDRIHAEKATNRKMEAQKATLFDIFFMISGLMMNTR